MTTLSRRLLSAVALLELLDEEVYLEEVVRKPDEHVDARQYRPEELVRALYWAQHWGKVRNLPPVPKQGETDGY